MGKRLREIVCTEGTGKKINFMVSHSSALDLAERFHLILIQVLVPWCMTAERLIGEVSGTVSCMAVVSLCGSMVTCT